jgi:hypothetical protein
MNLANIFEAVRIIEQEGIGGINTAIDLVGKPTAVALLITHLRRALGSMNSYPADSNIDIEVKNILNDRGLSRVNPAEFLRQKEILDKEAIELSNEEFVIALEILNFKEFDEARIHLENAILLNPGNTAAKEYLQKISS